jgi:hypothetical protein
MSGIEYGTTEKDSWTVLHAEGLAVSTSYTRTARTRMAGGTVVRDGQKLVRRTTMAQGVPPHGWRRALGLTLRFMTVICLFGR